MDSKHPPRRAPVVTPRRVALLAGVLAPGAVAAFVAHRTWRAHRLTATAPGTAPPTEAAVVLGARLRPDGSPTRVLEARLEVGLALLGAGRVERILVTGSARAPWGDEPARMQAWLLARGVAAERVLLDPLGLRTRDSLERAAHVFGLRRVAVCTQAFHLPRALCWAEAAGLRAVGVTASHAPGARRYLDYGREVAALGLAFTERHLTFP